jgi:hypothetical protein
MNNGYCIGVSQADFAACTYDIMNTINEAKTCVLLLCIHCIGVKQPDFAACTYIIDIEI